MWEQVITHFINYAQVEKGLSLNSLESYQRDLERFAAYAQKRGLSPANLSKQDVLAYQMAFQDSDIGARSQNRHLSAMRQLFRFCLREGFIRMNPAADIEMPKMPSQLPHFLSLEEVDAL